jgi:hypothetical protein
MEQRNKVIKLIEGNLEGLQKAISKLKSDDSLQRAGGMLLLCGEQDFLMKATRLLLDIEKLDVEKDLACATSRAAAPPKEDYKDLN